MCPLGPKRILARTAGDAGSLLVGPPGGGGHDNWRLNDLRPGGNSPSTGTKSSGSTPNRQTTKCRRPSLLFMRLPPASRQSKRRLADIGSAAGGARQAGGGLQRITRDQDWPLRDLSLGGCAAACHGPPKTRDTKVTRFGFTVCPDCLRKTHPKARLLHRST